MHCHAERHYRKSGLKVLKQVFKQVCNMCTLVVRKAKPDLVQCELDAVSSDPHGGSFFFVCEDFERMFDNSFPACTFF